jgi:uncharacterized membrane protein YphA (DoxX/SURF4 family)
MDRQVSDPSSVRVEGPGPHVRFDPATGALVATPEPTTLRYLPLLGRILLSHIFLLSFFGKVTNWSTFEGMMAAKGVPPSWVPFLLGGAAALELIGGLSVLFGFKARWGALLLVLFLIGVTPVMHNFWAMPDPKAFQEQLINFQKNVAMLGGLLMVIACGAGAVSFDRLLDRRRIAPQRL